MNWLRCRQMLALAASVSLFAASGAARADVTIDVTGGSVNAIPILIVPFAGETAQKQPVSPVVAADLVRSGMFRTVDASGLALDDQSVPDFDALSPRGMDDILVGSVRARADGQVDVRYRLLDEAQRKEIQAFSYTVPPAELRAVAHHISDQVYQRLTGIPGVFSTRILYVNKRGNTYQLVVADADGYEPQVIASSPAPIISPAWSPDGKEVAYVSFATRRPVIMAQSLATGRRRTLAAFPGNNSAPAWSPDGKRLCVVLTKDGHSQIYLINADGSGLTRLTHSIDIDTEPVFAPDGQSIVFTSDRGGSAQIYRKPLTGGPVQRLTFDGDYNVSPDLSRDGKSLAFIKRTNGHFQVAIQDLSSGQTRILTDDDEDESPRFAPNGKMIIYAKDKGGRGMLAVVTSDGRVKETLGSPSGDVRSPVWGPLVN